MRGLPITGRGGDEDREGDFKGSRPERGPALPSMWQKAHSREAEKHGPGVERFCPGDTLPVLRQKFSNSCGPKASSGKGFPEELTEGGDSSPIAGGRSRSLHACM